jgi:hypothetical protein
MRGNVALTSPLLYEFMKRLFGAKTKRWRRK